MVTEKDSMSWVQCQQCGHIYMERKLSEDTFVIESWCSKCGCETRALNCGEDINDIYVYMNVNVDPRNYRY